MAAHTDVRWRNTCRGRGLHGSVTITTVDAVVPDVMLMTELDRLLPLDPLTCVPRWTVKLRRHPKNRDEYKNGAVDRYLGERIRAVMKDLRHATALWDRSKTASVGETAVGQDTKHQGDTSNGPEELDTTVRRNLVQVDCVIANWGTLPDGRNFSNHKQIQRLIADFRL